jgi:hypothetical protein
LTTVRTLINFDHKISFLLNPSVYIFWYFKTGHSILNTCIYSAACLNQTSLGPTFVFRIYRCSVYSQRFPTLRIIKYGLCVIIWINISFFQTLTKQILKNTVNPALKDTSIEQITVYKGNRIPVQTGFTVLLRSKLINVLTVVKSYCV